MLKNYFLDIGKFILYSSFNIPSTRNEPSLEEICRELTYGESQRWNLYKSLEADIPVTEKAFSRSIKQGGNAQVALVRIGGQAPFLFPSFSRP